MPKPLPIAQTNGVRSCLSCPSNLNVTQQGAVFGRTIGGPVCGSKMLPTVRPGTPSEKKTAEHKARNCDMYGVDVDFGDGRGRPIELPIAMPDPAAKEPEDWTKEAVPSCNGCANFVPTKMVQRLTGWKAAFCKAKGSLLLEDRLSKYASNCTSRVKAAQHERLNEFDDPTGLVNIILFPEYAADFGLPKKIDPMEVHRINMSTLPSRYQSDLPVQPKHEAAGVLAWRRIQDPRGYGPAMILPIMNENAMVPSTDKKSMVPLFSDEDKASIPRSGSSEKPERYFDHDAFVYRTLVLWTRLKQTPVFWGEPGVGKTEVFRHLAWMMSMPFTRISITESSELDDLAGKMLYSPERGTYFQYGRIPRAWARPNILCLDEPNVGQPAVWQFIRPLTDDSKQLALDMNNGERISAHRISYLGMAMNPAWSPLNIGAAPLADADGSRLMHIEMNLPPENVEKLILWETLEEDGWERPEADKNINTLMRIAKELRAMSRENAIPLTWGLRNQKKVVRIRKYMSWTDSFRMGVIDSLEPSVREMVLNVVRSHDDEDSSNRF